MHEIEAVMSHIRRLPLPIMFAAIAGMILLYMLPAIIGFLRGHPKAKALSILNLVSGWEWWIWAGLLVWAIRGRSGADPRSTGRKPARRQRP